MLLKDKVIIVSGVGPGMGQTLAKIAAAEGAKVGLGARNQKFLDEVAEEIRAAGGECVALSTDVTNADQCRALGQQSLDHQRRNRIDIMPIYRPFWAGISGQVHATVPIHQHPFALVFH